MTFISIGAAAQQISDRLRRLHAEEQLLAALEAAGPSLAAATEIVKQHQGSSRVCRRTCERRSSIGLRRSPRTSFKLPAQPAGQRHRRRTHGRNGYE
jgi:hypothetical protein